MRRAIVSLPLSVKCPECGFDNLAELARCQQCGWLLAMAAARPAAKKTSAKIIVLDHAPGSGRPANPRNNGHETAPAGSSEEADESLLWRQEVSRRVRAYRSRRRPHIQGQEDFPFAHGESASVDPSPRLTAAPVRRRREPDRIELPIVQPMLAFEDADPQPVASLAPPAAAAERLRAGLLDLAIVLSSYATFLALFAALGHELPLSKAGLAIYGLVLLLFFTAYLFLFTAFGGRTPGMRFVGLELVRFDGRAPALEDALWRTAGYLVSTGSFFLGFLWIFVDDRQLTWHDRISKTCVVAAPSIPLSGKEAA